MPGSLFLWGLLALLQLVFLPGHLLTRALRLRLSIVDGLLVTFGLSSLVNYLAIQFLVLGHVYKQPVMLAIIALELLVILWLWGRPNTANRWQVSAEAYRDALAGWQKLISPERVVVLGIALFAVFSTFALIHAATAAWQDEGFTLWDNVMSWDRWAKEWSTNKFPWKTYHYPQLLPANSSIVYLLAGSTAVQAFNRLYFAFFPVAIFVCLIDLGLRHRQIGYWVSLPFIYFAWIYMARPFPAEGYADVPVTFMMLMTVYSAILADAQAESSPKIRWMLAAGLFAAAAMVTKQTGILITVTLPIFLSLLTDTRRLLAPLQKRKVIVWTCVLALVLTVPWYILKEFQIRTGADQSEILAAASAHGGRDLMARMQHGIREMFAAWGTAQTVIVAILAFATTFLRNPWSWVARLIVVPGFFIWAITTSYDLRNSNFVVILGCASAGVTLGHLLARVSVLWRSWSLLRRNLLVAAVVAGLVVALSFIPTVANPSLKDRSNKTQKTTAMPELNAEIFRLIDTHKMTRPVITNYWMMFFIPGLKEFMTYDSLTESHSFDELMQKTKPEYIVILHPGQNYAMVSEQVVAEHVADGRWSVAATGGAYQIIQVNRLDPPPDPPVVGPAPVPPLVQPAAAAAQVVANPIPAPNPLFSVFKVLSGLTPEEGPYPQWNLPVVRWGLGPVTALEYEATLDEPLELSFEIERPAARLTAEILLNGAAVARLDIPPEPTVKRFKYALNSRAGTNSLEIRYSAWDTQSESRPLAILYRSIQIIPKK